MRTTAPTMTTTTATATTATATAIATTATTATTEQSARPAGPRPRQLPANPSGVTFGAAGHGLAGPVGGGRGPSGWSPPRGANAGPGALAARRRGLPGC